MLVSVNFQPTAARLMTNLSVNSTDIICTDPSSAIYIRCDCQLPMFMCAFANICGYASTVVWFIVLLPQVLRCWRYRSVDGISPAWAILNFTAALNNAFFVFKMGNMPW
jgi:hypothetical protein